MGRHNADNTSEGISSSADFRDVVHGITEANIKGVSVGCFAASELLRVNNVPPFSTVLALLIFIVLRKTACNVYRARYCFTNFLRLSVRLSVQWLYCV